MELSQVKQAIAATPKGANIIVEWNRPCKMRKKVVAPAPVIKSVRMVGRIGVDYDNQQAVIAKRESGELPAEPQPIWNGKGQWDIFPFLIRHVDTEQQYLRFYRGTSDKVHPEVHFFMNGVECSKDEVKPYVLNDEIESDHEGVDALCIKIESLTRLHHESEWLMIVGGIDQEKVEVQPIPAKVLAAVGIGI